MCDWGGNGKLFFFLLSFLRFPHPHRAHMRALPHLLPATTTTITTGTQQKTTMMQLTSCASPAILGVVATSPKMAPLSAPILQGSSRVFVRLLAREKVFPVGSTDGIRGSWVKRVMVVGGWWGGGGGDSEPSSFPPLSLLSFNGGSTLLCCVLKTCKMRRQKREKEEIKQLNAHFDL